MAQSTGQRAWGCFVPSVIAMTFSMKYCVKIYCTGNNRQCHCERSEAILLNISEQE
jgi:hypothetical protein